MSRLNMLLLLAFFISFLKYVAFLNPIKQHSKETMHRRLFGNSSSAFLRPSALSLNCGKQKRKRRYNKTFKMTIQVSTNSDQLGLLLRVMLFFIINKKYLAYKTKLTIDKSKSQLMEGIDPEINEWVWSQISYKPTPYIKMFDFGHDIVPTMLSQSLVYTVMNMSRLASYSSVCSVERPISFLQLSEAGFRYSEQENVIVCDGCCMRGNSLMITEGTSPSNAIYHNNGCQYIQEGPPDNRVDVPGSAAPMASNSATQNEDIITSQRSNNALSGISRVRSIESLSTVVPTEECPAIGGVNLDTISEVIPTINRADSSRNGASTLSTFNSGNDSQSFTLPSAGVTACAASPEAAPTATALSEAAGISVFNAHKHNCLGSAITLRVYEKSNSGDQSHNTLKDVQTRHYEETIDRTVSTTSSLPFTVRQRDSKLYEGDDSVDVEIESLAIRKKLTSRSPVDFSTSSGRAMSFLQNGPLHLRHSANDLANQGIFYTGRQAIVRCYKCNMSWSLDLCNDVARTLENHPLNCPNLSRNLQM